MSAGTPGKAEERADRPGIWHEVDGTLAWTALGTILDQADTLVGAMEARGVGAADTVVIVSQPRPEILAVEEAVARIGARLVVVGPTASPQNASMILEHEAPRLVFCCFPAQAAVVSRLISADIVTFDGGGDFITWEALLGLGAPETPPASLEKRSFACAPAPGRAPVRRGDRVVCTADTSSGPVREVVWSVLAAGGAVALVSREATGQAYHLIDPAGVVAPASDVEDACNDLLDRAPRTTTVRSVLRLSVPAAGVVGWGALSAADVSTSASRAVVAMAITCVLAGICALRGGAPRWIAMVAGVAGGATALHIIGRAPSLQAAFEFFVVVSVALGLARAVARGVASAVWRRGLEPPALSGASPSAPGRWRAPLGSLAQLARRRVTRSALGLGSCRWIAVQGQSRAHETVQLLLCDVAIVDVDARTTQPELVIR